MAMSITQTTNMAEEEIHHPVSLSQKADDGPYMSWGEISGANSIIHGVLRSTTGDTLKHRIHCGTD